MALIAHVTKLGITLSSGTCHHKIPTSPPTLLKAKTKLYSFLFWVIGGRSQLPIVTGMVFFSGSLPEVGNLIKRSFGFILRWKALCVEVCLNKYTINILSRHVPLRTSTHLSGCLVLSPLQMDTAFSDIGYGIKPHCLAHQTSSQLFSLHRPKSAIFLCPTGSNSSLLSLRSLALEEQILSALAMWKTAWGSPTATLLDVAEEVLVGLQGEQEANRALISHQDEIF